MKLTNSMIVERLEKIAIMVNRLDADLKAQYGEYAEVFFEAEGGIHAMDGDDNSRRSTASSRQKHIIASARTNSRHGVGAW